MATRYDFQPADRFHSAFWLVNGSMIRNTEEEAQALCKVLDEYFAAMTPIRELPEALSRAEYEAACQAAGQVPGTDAECDDYCVKYGKFDAPEYPVSRCVEMALAKRRLAGIEAERAAQPKPALKPIRYIRCDCGHQVPEGQVMNASLGTSCTDCYDRMSG